MDPFIGEIRQFAGTFAPRGWHICDGQLISISSNTALFSLLGTKFGGDGRNTFALPDLRGRAPMGHGNGPGLTPRKIGEQTGKAEVALTPAEMAAHNHAANASVVTANSEASPTDSVWTSRSGGRGSAGIPIYGAAENTNMSSLALGTSGNQQAHNNMQPYLPLNFIIAATGVFPQRS